MSVQVLVKDINTPGLKSFSPHLLSTERSGNYKCNVHAVLVIIPLPHQCSPYLWGVPGFFPTSFYCYVVFTLAKHEGECSTFDT